MTIERFLNLLNERNGSAGDERELDTLPVLFAYIINDCPALKERFARLIEHHAVSGLPDRSGDRITDDHLALAFASGGDSDRLCVAAACGGRGVGELCDILARSFIEQFDTADLIEIEVLQFSRFRGDDERSGRNR